MPRDALDRLRAVCPIVASYGRRDRRLRGDAERLDDALTELAVPRDVKEYPEAGHSFLNRINVGLLFVPLARLAGFDYHHPSAGDAWRRIFTFFDQYLSDSTDGAPPSAQAAAERTTWRTRLGRPPSTTSCWS